MTMQAALPPINITDFSRGCGASTFQDGFYGICVGADCRFGYVMPGPREVVDLTGIPAGFRVVKAVRHVNVWVLATTDGTDTKICQLATTWVVIATITSRVATDIVSFNSVLAVAFGSSNAYQFSTNTTVDGSAYTFTASTKTAANSSKANYFLVQSNGVVTPQVAYVVSPNELYFTQDLTNTDGTGITATYIGDNNTTANYVTSITEDDTGKLLIGLARALWGLSGDGTLAQRLTPNFPIPLTDAGGQGDRKNFEAYCEVEGKIYYIVNDYDILEYDHGRLNTFMAPRWQGKDIPRMHLPINAICAVGNQVVVALGSANTATLKGVAEAPGGTARQANTFTTASELYVGSYMADPVDGNVRFTWHGSILSCTSLLRYMWFDSDTDYLYLSSGASESANFQQRRCIFVKDNPLYHLKSSAIVLNTGTYTLEILGITAGDSYMSKRANRIRCHTVGLGVPSLQVKTKLTGNYDATAFTALIRWSTTDAANPNINAEIGEMFPEQNIFRTMDVQFVGVGDASGNTYPILVDARIELAPVENLDQPRPRR